MAIGIPKPATPEEEEETVRRFLSGPQNFLRKKTTGPSCSPALCPWSMLRPVPNLFGGLHRF
jgi:hypothetical protein